MNSIAIAAASHAGLKRSENQDFQAYCTPSRNETQKRGILMAVADGMGGHSGGRVASRTAIETLEQEYYRNPVLSIPQALTQAVKKANAVVFDRGAQDISLMGMGTTLTAFVVLRRDLYYAHVGDSRGYLIRGNQITQITSDHSYVASMVEAGIITPEEAKSHKYENIITRAVGKTADVKPDVERWPRKLGPHDVILLCSDGLYKMVSDDTLVETVQQYREPDTICTRLIEKANQNGGTDNITVLIARIAKAGWVSLIGTKIGTKFLHLMR